jgi:hypothetical protein
MNGYKAFYKEKEMEVYAPTAYMAQQQAFVAFRARKPWEVTVMLCEMDGVQVEHVADV